MRTMNQANGPATAMFLIATFTGVAVAILVKQPGFAIVGALIGLYFLFAIKVAQQWEKVAVLRLGRYVGLRGPGESPGAAEKLRRVG